MYYDPRVAILRRYVDEVDVMERICGRFGKDLRWFHRIKSMIYDQGSTIHRIKRRIAGGDLLVATAPSQWRRPVGRYRSKPEATTDRSLPLQARGNPLGLRFECSTRRDDDSLKRPDQDIGRCRSNPEGTRQG